ncbi:MAG TPA: hypothetical protein VE775_11990 [Pyrinomonadaceae bacterium]|jgi:ElaB/YqjD/DUF883 family membrane-anchored ribosome-binding protein|nr:hypothetical protein [Pyrinomonadaceae bacterium]
MSQNFNDPTNPTSGGTTGGGGTMGDTSTTGTGANSGGGGLQTAGGGGPIGAGAATATAREGIAGTAQEYGQKIADAASQAKDYVSDKVSVVGDRLKDLQNVDYKQVGEDAKAYARENPGQALLISAAAGFLLGLLLRGSRR